MKLPVYQMVFAMDYNSDRVGLAFSSEVEQGLFLLQQPLYVIPVGNREPENMIYLNTFDLPGELYGERVNFELRPSPDERLAINDDRLNYPVRFTLFVRSFDYLIGNSLRYIGRQTDIIPGFFVILEPMDLLIMDQLYREQGACFVGYTPMYGLSNDQLRRDDFVSV